jgi:DNA repair protein RadD
MLTLRQYQQDAIEQLYAWFRLRKHEPEVEHNPLVVAPTGSGKSLLIAKIIHDALVQFQGQRVLVLTHVKELIEQDHAKLMAVFPECDAGIYSASIGLRHTNNRVIFAGIQSVADKATLLGEFHLVLIDEAHLIPHAGMGRYRRFLNHLRQVNGGKLRVVGFTATPYRLDSGYLHEGEGRLFTDIGAQIELLPLIEAGYLAPLTAKRTSFTVDLETVKKRGGEFVIGDAGTAMMADGNTGKAIEDAAYRGSQRNHWIVFACTIEHAAEICHELNKHGISNHLVTGQTPKRTREAMLDEFRLGKVRALVNVGVLTTGVDLPLIDCIVLLRPTASTGLYLQMLGRGMRPHDDKADCLVLDYAGNIERHGCVDDPNINLGKVVEDREPGEPVVKTCPECESIVHAKILECPQCGHAFPPPKPKVADIASEAALISTQWEPVIQKATMVRFSEYKKPTSEYQVTRVDYLDDSGIWPVKVATEFVCDFHPEGSWAKKQADRWWMSWGCFGQFDLLDHAASKGSKLNDQINDSGLFLKLDLRGKYPKILDRIIGERHADAA